MSTHTANALIIHCIDFRFQKFIRNWTDENLVGKAFDLVSFAGSTKNLDIIMEQITISVRLHEIKRLILIHHEDCGAYGSESSPERHAQDLKQALEKVLSKYPDLQVDLFYLHLDGKFEAVN